MKNILLTTTILLMVPSVIADNCDCTVFPFKPDSCWPACTAKLIATATEEELQLFVGLDDSLSKAVMKVDQTDKPFPEPYKQALTSGQLETLSRRLRTLNSLQIKYFQKTPEQRATVRRDIRDLLAK